MARTGLDEFHETVKLLFAKASHERSGKSNRLDYQTAQEILRAKHDVVQRFVDGSTQISAPQDVANECLNVLEPTNLTSIGFEALDAAFEGMTSYEAKSDKGQFFTPRHVIDFCIDVLRPSHGESVCDPACGSAAFLHSALKFADSKKLELYGFDISRKAMKTANLMSYFACGDSLHLSQLDSLALQNVGLIDPCEHTLEQIMKTDGREFSGFDVIATNPPFAGDVSSADFASQYETARFSAGKVERDVLFLERCIKLLRPGGRMAIVLPDNKISAVKFAFVRRWLISQASIIGVVSLHSNTFRPYTSQKAAVLFVQKPNNGRVVANQIELYRSDKPGKNTSGEYVYSNGKIDHDLGQIMSDLTEKWKI